MIFAWGRLSRPSPTTHNALWVFARFFVRAGSPATLPTPPPRLQGAPRTRLCRVDSSPNAFLCGQGTRKHCKTNGFSLLFAVHQHPPKTHKTCPKPSQDATKTAPRRPQDGPRRPQDTPRRTQDAPRRPQDASKTPQSAPLTPIKRPKTPPGRIQDAPRHPQDAQKTPQDALRTHPRRSQDGFRLALLGKES